MTTVDPTKPMRPWVRHVLAPGSREHVVSYDVYGPHCSEPRCEINRGRAEEKRLRRRRELERWRIRRPHAAKWGAGTSCTP